METRRAAGCRAGCDSLVDRPHAILLVGPTGSGKTPLGELLERAGLWGRRCRHFDFGEQMRRIVAAASRPPYLTDADVRFLREVLAAGALLEDEHFPIAEAILRAFVGEPPAGGALVVLNGLPRHVGQAEAVERIVRAAAVVELACTPEVVLRRIRADSGGDRAGRTDDDEASVRKKLAIFAERTAPLLEHYRRRAVPIRTVRIAAATTAEDVRSAINRAPPEGL